MVATLAGKAGKAGKCDVFQKKKKAGKAGKGYHFSSISAGKTGFYVLYRKWEWSYEPEIVYLSKVLAIIKFQNFL